MNPIDDFKQHVDAKKQHEVDTAIQDLNHEKNVIKRKYDFMLEDFNAFKENCEWLNLLSGAYAIPKPIKPINNVLM